MRDFDPLMFIVIFDEFFGRAGLIGLALVALAIFVLGIVGLRRLHRAGRLARALTAFAVLGVAAGIAAALVLPAFTGGAIARVHGVDVAILALFAAGVATAVVFVGAAVAAFRRSPARK